VKRLLALLIVLAGGLAWAAFAVPSNAATVNGAGISQQDLNSDVNAIAGSAYYQCYLNSETYLSSNGSEQLPSVVGAGTGQYVGDHPTATSAFVANYLETEIGHQLLLQLASEHHVTVTQSELVAARASLTLEISNVMSEILQTQLGQNVSYSCSLTGQALTGKQVLDTMPASFVDKQVQFGATAAALEEDLAGVGSSDQDLQAYYVAHGAQFDKACLTAAVFSSESAAQDAAAQAAFGTPFATVATNTASSGGGVQGCEITSRTPTPYNKAAAAVVTAVQAAGSTATQKALTVVERRSSVSVNPQYGVWVPVSASVFTPLAPEPADVLNATANVGRVAPAAVSGSASSSSIPSSG
jgi:hypothetical protein